MAFQPADDLAQADSTGKLAVKQRYQLALCRQAPDMLVGLVLIHKPFESCPRNPLHQVMKYAILVPHGVAPCACPDRRQTPEHE
jgi:hypothetical protein